LIERKPGVKIPMETRVDDILRDEDILGKYKKAEIDHIYEGVEATSQAALDAFRKNIKVEESRRALDLINKHDIVSETSFVLGMPDDTKDSIRNTVELAKFYNPDLAFFLAIAPWPYSEIYPMLKDHIAVRDYSRYNLVEPVVKPNNMTLEEVTSELGRASSDFYMHKMKNLDRMSARKREFMVKVVHIIATSSYLAGA
jgi:anaerobic magnesium-protoporphyrin IX monomethyl ester cyclase